MEFYLNNLVHFDHILRQAVYKFDFLDGIKFYRSCKGAEEYVDCLEPKWNVTGAGEVHLYFTKNKCLFFAGGLTKEWKGSPSRSIEDPRGICFLNVDTLTLQSNNEEYTHKTLLPELTKIKKVNELYLRKGTINPSEETVAKIIAAAQFNWLVLSAEEFDGTNTLFEGIKNIRLYELQCQQTDEELLLKLCQSKEAITLSSRCFCTKHVTDFIQTWLEGKDIGLLKELTVGSNRKYEDWLLILKHIKSSLQPNAIVIDETTFSLKRKDGHFLMLKKGASEKEAVFLFQRPQ